MSSQNVDLAMRAIAAVAGDDEDAAAPCFHPDVEWHNTAAFPGERTLVGPRAILDFWSDLSAAFADPDGSPGSRVAGRVESIAEGADCVVLEMHSRGTGTASGIPVDLRWAITFRIRDQRIARVDIHGRYADAVEAAGL